MNKLYICLDDIIDNKNVYVNLFDKKIQITSKETEEPKGTIDSGMVKDYITNLRCNNRKAVIGVVTTYECNLCCTYCYEKGFQNRNLILTEEICLNIIRYIKEYIHLYDLSDLRILFTGGEPTLKKDAIIKISKEISNYCQRLNINFCFSIVTNGTIDFIDIIPQLRSYGLDIVQVSLDGPEEIHNKRRLAGFNAFKKSISFISQLTSIENLSIIIRTNVDGHNAKYIDAMLSEISQYIEGRNVFFDFVQTEEPLCNRNNKISEQKKEVNDMLEAYRSIRKFGFKLVKVNPFHRECANFVEEGCFVDPGGEIYKCGGMLGHETESICNIKNITCLKDYVRKYIDAKVYDECLSCNLFPICGGGCIYQKHYSEQCNDEYKKQVQLKLKTRTTLYLAERNIINIK